MITAIRIVVLAALLGAPILVLNGWIRAADARSVAAAAPAGEPSVAVAAASDVGYCSPDLKRILRRVLQSCGLVSASGGNARGCQPLQAKSVATVSGDDFNALFLPMKTRGGIVQFDMGKAELDANDLALVDKVFADQRGGSYFFVVSRSSPEGSTESNRELSKARAEAVMTHLRETFKDPDLDKEVGLLWLGEEFAQLDQQFCEWTRSNPEECKTEQLNRSAFIAWIDCQL
jgi:outer membrane protein OmpA-like peptidoglycan-associated protein